MASKTGADKPLKPIKARKADSDSACNEHVHWKHEPEEHDFPAAEDFLSLLMPDPDAKAYRKKFQELRHQIVHRRAKDIFRASGLVLVPETNRHVMHNMEKIRAGEKLSPLLLVRGNYQRHLIVADGYHRMCTSYYLSEDMNVPCVLL